MKEVNRYKNCLDKRYSIKLNSNESFKSIDGDFIIKAIDELKNEKLNNYPDSDSNILKECYGKVIGIESENIIVGNGSDEMIALAIGAVISKGKRVFTLNPDFTMYDFYTTSNEGTVVKFNTKRDGSFSVGKFIEMGITIAPDLIIISNPNNPTGYALGTTEIKQILQVFPKAKVLIDEAYYEFYGQTVIPFIEEFPNLIVTRTLSKAWGLAALRVGFLISNKSLIKELNKYKVPYNVNSISQHIAAKVLQYPEKVLNNVMEVIEERERLFRMLLTIEEKYNGKIRFYNSKGNFIFCRSFYIKYIKGFMENQGVLLRYFNDDSFRITVGNSLENDLVVAIMNNALEEMEADDERKMWGSY